MLIIRSEEPANGQDVSDIRLINEAAFGGPKEADLVDELRANGDILLSLVGEFNKRTVGHVLFSRMWIDTENGRVAAAALAPLAVLPEYQRQGVGSRLIEAGVQILRRDGEKIVIVLGHPEYYPKFGFSVEKAQNLQSPFRRDSFMALELSDGALAGIPGRVVYPPAFGL